MEERSSHFTIVVGASAVAEDLRRLLVQNGVAHAGVTTHLRGLRRSMVMGDGDLVILCIALDQPTIQRHGESLRKLLADCHCFPQAVRSIGLLPEIGLTQDIVGMGCDIYAHDSEEAARAMKLLARRWRSQRGRSEVTAASAGSDSPVTWTWGTSKLPFDVASVSLGEVKAVEAEGKSSARQQTRDVSDRCSNRSRKHPPGFE